MNHLKSYAYATMMNTPPLEKRGEQSQLVPLLRECSFNLLNQNKANICIIFVIILNRERFSQKKS